MFRQWFYTSDSMLALILWIGLTARKCCNFFKFIDYIPLFKFKDIIIKHIGEITVLTSVFYSNSNTIVRSFINFYTLSGLTLNARLINNQ
jgi:hypothetical protein